MDTMTQAAVPTTALVQRTLRCPACFAMLAVPWTEHTPAQLDATDRLRVVPVTCIQCGWSGTGRFFDRE